MGRERDNQLQNAPHVLVVGSGFAGLYAAKTLGRAGIRTTVIDKRNFHLFQPLLYQVATGGLSPGEIASPIRAVLSRYKKITVLAAEVSDIDPVQKKVILRDGEIAYDTLIVATGVSHHYFGHDDWASVAPGLKTIEDSIEMRRRIFLAFEAAEREPDPKKREAWMTFVIVGGGPTGVELAGALGELAGSTLKNDFRSIDSRTARIIVLEGTDRLLPTYPRELSLKAAYSLQQLGVTVKTGSLVTDIHGICVTFKQGDSVEDLEARTILWAAGVKASPLGALIGRRAGVSLDRVGRVMVNPDLSVPGHPSLFVIGDLAHCADRAGKPLPGVASVAMQEGRYVAKLIQARFSGKTLPPFRYRDKGSLAVIGRHAAVAHFGKLRFNGFLAWIVWIFVHIRYLIEFDNKILVLVQWAWNYVTRKRGARLITGPESCPVIEKTEK